MTQRRKQLLNPNTVVLLKHILTGLFVLFGAGLILVAVWYGTRVQSLTITDIEVKGGETISHEKVKSLVLSEFEGAYLGLIPKRFA